MPDSRQFAFGPGSAWINLNQYTDGTVPVIPQLLKFDVMQDLNITFDRSIKELWGQLQFPVAIANADGKVSAKIHQARFQPGLLQATIGQPTAFAAGTSLIASDDDLGISHQIPVGTPWQVTVVPPGAGVYSKDWGVRYAATGLPLKKVASGPTVGQYSQAAAVYTFSTADASLFVLISYEYTVTTGTTLTYANILQGATPFSTIRYQDIYGGRYIGCLMPNLVGAKFDIPTKQKDWVISQMDFSAFADSSNNVAYLYFTEPAVG